MLEERTATGLHAALLPTVEELEGISHDSPILDLGCGGGAGSSDYTMQGITSYGA